MSSHEPPGPEQPNPYGAPPPYQQSPYGPPQQQPGGYGYQPYVVTPPPDGLALASMIVGIVSLALACAYGIGLLGSPAALVMGRISMKRIDQSQGQASGRGFAMAGFVLGIIGSILLLLGLIAVAVIVTIAVGGGFDGGSDYSNY